MNQNLNDTVAKINLPVEQGIDFRNLIYNFWENKFIILLSIISIVLIALSYTLFRAPTFEASVLLQVESKNQNSGLGNLSHQFNLGASDNKSAGIQIALIRSRVILEPVINELGLAISAEEHFFPIFGKFFSSKTKSHLHIQKMLVARQYYNKTLNLIVDDNSHYRLIDNNKTLLSGEVGKVVKGNGIVIEVDKIDAQPETKFDVIRRPTIDLERLLRTKLRIEELGDGTGGRTGILQISLRDTNPQRLTHILNAISKVTREKDSQRKSLETAKTLDFLNQQLPVVKGALQESESALNQYRANSGKLDIGLETQHLIREISTVEKQITQMRLSKADLLQKYTLKHPIIIGINHKVEQLTRQKILLQEQVKALPASDQVTINLLRDVKVKNSLYLILLKKIQELQVAKAGTLSSVRL